MLFNSFNFIFFILPILVAYYFLNKLSSINTKNIFLLTVSYIFYGLYDIRFLAILIYITLINYISISFLLKKQSIKIITWCIVLSLLPLLFFKYSNFILRDVFLIESNLLAGLLLPIGISFYTFQALSYSIDVYRKKETTKPSLLTFSLFVSFFPCILSGPIERARNLMPQILKHQRISANLFFNGIQVFLWGLFQKNVVAEGLAWYTDGVYKDYSVSSGFTIWLAIFLYSIQIYCDFAGYSNMAIGIGRMLGFDIKMNFNFPYISTTIRDFWKKWHISLTSWLTEYLYFSIGGNKVSQIRWVLNIMIVFLVSGIWHGAAWTFIVWGIIHGAYQIIEHYVTKPNTKFNIKISSLIRCLFLYFVVSIAWLLFRSASISEAYDIVYYGLVNPFGTVNTRTITIFVLMVVSLLMFIVFDLLLYKRKITILEICDNPFKLSNLFFTLSLILSIEFLGQSGTSFVYFQF